MFMLMDCEEQTANKANKKVFDCEWKLINWNCDWLSHATIAGNSINRVVFILMFNLTIGVPFARTFF